MWQVYDRKLCKSIPVKCLKKFTHKDFTFFIHRALENDHFVCSEAESGAAVCRRVTKKEVFKGAIAILERKTKRQIKYAIRKAIEQQNKSKGIGGSEGNVSLYTKGV
jgi:hypothetical protein